MKKPKLVNDWKSSWRWFSMWAMGVSSALQLAWLSVPEDLRDKISPTMVVLIASLILILGMIGRLIQQQK